MLIVALFDVRNCCVVAVE